MNQQRYSRSPVPRRAGLPQPIINQAYSDDMIDSDDYENDVYDDAWPPPAPRSAIRYTTTQEAAPVIVSGNRRYVLHSRLPQPPQQNIPQPRPPSRPQPQVQPRPQPRPQLQAQPEDEEEIPQPRPRSRRRVHWSLVFGIGMVAMLGLWVLGNMLISWWNTTQDDWHYGRPII